MISRLNFFERSTKRFPIATLCLILRAVPHALCSACEITRKAQFRSSDSIRATSVEVGNASCEKCLMCTIHPRRCFGTLRLWGRGGVLRKSSLQRKRSWRRYHEQAGNYGHAVISILLHCRTHTFPIVISRETGLSSQHAHYLP